MPDKEVLEPSPRGLVSLALVCNKAGEVLLLDRKDRSTDPDRWGLPGGSVGLGEEVPIACHRQVTATTGLKIIPDRLLVMHQMPADGDKPEEVSSVFSTKPAISGDQITVGEAFAGYRWVHPVYLGDLLPSYMKWRIRCALDAMNGFPVRFLVGHPDAEAWEREAA